MKNEYYSLSSILKKKAIYNIIYGERSNGKTFSVLKYGLKQYIKEGKQLGIIRRWREDFTGKRGQTMFNGIVSAGIVKELTKGIWTDIYYYGSKWYLCRYEGEEKKKIQDEKPFCYAFALTSMEHDKSTSYPDIGAILFDEFITRTAYLPDEFILFMNTLSTIIRDRSDVTIFMLGNTVNKYCPYFNEMGLTNAYKMEPGTIDVYTYSNKALTVAVEYVNPTKKGKGSDIYFAFDNPKLQMITSGTWEIDIYPHCPVKYPPKSVLFKFYIVFNDQILEAEIVSHECNNFIFIHPKKGELKDIENDLIYSPEFSPLPNWRRNLLNISDNIGRKVAYYFTNDKVFYADNETGEIVRNFLIWSRSNK